nr:probable L-type lectin-domain containing receptor kinase S.5 [Ipomoea batatas]
MPIPDESGGFGSVYKGVLSGDHPPSTVAIKRINATSHQGEREYLAEICTIGRLRHKNQVQLQGWCHDREQILIVYEYMPNSSLDRYIGNNIFLNWETRFKILSGLASMLLYLHEECGSPVVHRDDKPNNVMLDSDYTTHLGDFGLARLLHTGQGQSQDEASVNTMVVETPEYLAQSLWETIQRNHGGEQPGGHGVAVVRGRRRTVGCGFPAAGWEIRGRAGEMMPDRGTGVLASGSGRVFRPKMRKVVQIFLNPEEPLM